MKRYIGFLFGIINFFIPTQGSSNQVVEDIAIVGDELSMGAVAHSQLYFSSQQFLGILSGEIKIDPLPADLLWLKKHGFQGELEQPPVFLQPTMRDFSGGIQWFTKVFLAEILRKYINTERYSWGYLLGSQFGVSGSSIYLAAENGAGAASTAGQMDRILNRDDFKLPHFIFILFGTYDLCTSFPFVPEASVYEDSIRTGLEVLVNKGKTGFNGTKIFLVDPVGLLQIVQSKIILNKKVIASGEQVTCGQVHDPKFIGQTKTSAIGQDSNQLAELVDFLPKNPIRFCPALFLAESQQKLQDKRIKLANRLREYRDALGRLQKEFSKREIPDLQFYHLQKTRSLVFSEQDIAEDCFHFSFKGQFKIAELVRKDVKAALKLPAD